MSHPASTVPSTCGWRRKSTNPRIVVTNGSMHTRRTEKRFNNSLDTDLSQAIGAVTQWLGHNGYGTPSTK